MIKSKLGLSALALVLGAALAAPLMADTRTFDLTGFDRIGASEGLSVSVTTGDVFDVSATSDDARQLDRLELAVAGTTLTAGMDDPSFSLLRTRGWQVRVSITLPTLVQVSASSGVNLTAETMTGTALEIAASSGATIRIGSIEGETISANVSSGAGVNILAGTCGSLLADASSGATMDAGGVICTDARIDAGSGSGVTLHATGSVIANASSGATIRIYGAPQVTEVETSSGATIDLP